MHPHVVISYLHSIGEGTFEEFAKAVSVDGLDLILEAREENRFFAAMEWLLPTAVTIFITKPYFESFLKEMGSDHYKILKQGIKNLIGKLRSVWVAAIRSKGKIEEGRKYSLVYSIFCEIDHMHQFKFLIQEDIQESKLDEVIISFLDFLMAFHDGSLDEDTIKKLANCRSVGGTILVAYGRESKRIEPVDPIPKR